MATKNPVTVTTAWTLVHAGAFTGAIQRVGGSAIVGRVSVGAPAAGAGGFSVTESPTPIKILGSESLYARTVGGVSAVVLA